MNTFARIMGRRNAKDVKALKAATANIQSEIIGDVEELSTTEKSIVGAVNEVKAATMNVMAGHSVKNYGAKGDGTADDTQAFVSALTAANGELVIVPSGIYNVNTVTTDGLNINMVGIGKPVIQLKTTVNNKQCLHIKNANSIHVEGIVFDAESEAHEQDAFDLACVFITNSKNINISKCKFQNAYREALAFFGVTTDLNIQDCVYHNVSSHCWITGGYCQNVKFLRNYSTNGRRQGFEIDNRNTQISSNILIEGNTFIDIGDATANITQVKNITYRNNKIVSTTGTGYTYAIRMLKPTVLGEGYAVDEVYAENNVCENIYRFLSTETLAEHMTPYCGTILVKGNKFNTRSAVMVFYDTNEVICDSNIAKSSAYCDLYYVSKITINNDTVDNSDTGVKVTGDTDVTIKNASFGSPKLYGVYGGTPNIKIKQTSGNFNSVIDADHAYCSLASGCKNVSTTAPIARYTSATKLLRLPLAGEICYITGQTTASEVTDLAGLNDYVVTIICGAYATTYKTTGNIVTKSGSDVVVGAKEPFRVAFFDNKWNEV